MSPLGKDSPRAQLTPFEEYPLALNYEVGRKGESLARGFLESEGYCVLKSNFRCPIGEIDFICQEGKAVVFVEVKTRTNNEAGAPEEAVHARKQKKLYRVAEWYLNEAGYRGEYPVRFDVISILAEPGSQNPDIKIFRNAFSL